MHGMLLCSDSDGLSVMVVVIIFICPVGHADLVLLLDSRGVYLQYGTRRKSSTLPSFI